MGAATYLLWFRAAGVKEQIFDTNDLSTIRGSSLALRYAPEIAEAELKRQPGIVPERIFSGASQALFRLQGDKDAVDQALRALRKALGKHGQEPADIEAAVHAARRANVMPAVLPLAHLRFVTGLVDVTGIEGRRDASIEAVRKARGMARLAQAQGEYARHSALPTGTEPPRRMCGFDRRRPADSVMKLPASQAERYEAETITAPDADRLVAVPVSKSVHARRTYGRYARQAFYAGITDNHGWSADDKGRFGFVDDLHDMIALPEEVGRTMPEAVRGKIAVFYADGDKFGALRADIGETPEGLASFSKKTTTLMENTVLPALISPLTSRARSPMAASAIHYDDDRWDKKNERLRFELLLFGGDEICWVAPAWLGLELAKAFFAAINNAEIEGHSLTFSAGLVFAPQKMPIADSRNLAEELARNAKALGGKRLAFHAFESVEPPADGMERLRNTLFGDLGSNPSAVDLLAVEGDRVGKFIQDIIQLKEKSIPKSQLHNMLGAAQRKGLAVGQAPRQLGDREANAQAATAFVTYSTRMGLEHDDLTRELANPESAAVRAWLLTHLWDYADPLKDRKKNEVRS